jgi:glycine betaine/proline transport system substrate-binding protein
MGYKTSELQGSWTIDLESVAKGDNDVDLGLWLPTEKSAAQPLIKAGKIKLLVKNVPDAKYDLVVPDYVWKAGVHCICDLHKYANKFGHTVYGIEAGNDGNVIVKNMIKNNTYNLSGWQLQPSSTAAMLTEAGRKIAKHKWVVFLGWKPHWMNIKYNLRYLQDPKKIWGGPSSVNTVINPHFAAANPNVTKFFKQMVVGAKIQSHWIYQYGFKKKPLDQVAKTWIAHNLDTVGQWLKGVKTANGKQAAIAAVKAKFAAT